jgi:GntR family transcriptional regulator
MIEIVGRPKEFAVPGEPKWRTIAEDLRQKIESGELGGDGKPLPTELELRGEYSASRNTVRDAIKWLVTRDLIRTGSGQRTFVSKPTPQLVTDLLSFDSGKISPETARGASGVSDSVLKVEILQATGDVARELEISEGTPVVCRHQRRVIGNVPYSLQTTFYAMSLAQAGAPRLLIAEDIGESVVTYLDQTLGIKQAGTRDTFTVRKPDDNETDFFGLPDDGRIAVIQILRTGYAQDGEPFRVTKTTYPSDRNAFTFTQGQVPSEPTAASAQSRPS